MAANQTQLPVIQTSDSSLTQVQQNANKVLRNLNNQITTLTTSLDQLEVIGEVKLSSLTLTQFQAATSTSWIEANGQSSVGTAYAQLTGNNTVPNVSVSGVNAYIKVNS